MLRGIRGAACTSQNTKEAIFETTTSLLNEVLKANSLSEKDIISIMMTATSDLNAVSPAFAIRSNGLKEIPVLCSAEIAVEGSMSRVIRMLVHVETDLKRSQIKHIYLGEAAKLRPDLVE